MVALLSSFLLNQKENHDKLTDTLAEIAGLDWASDQSFNAKVCALYSFSAFMCAAAPS